MVIQFGLKNFETLDKALVRNDISIIVSRRRNVFFILVFMLEDTKSLQHVGLQSGI